MSFDFESISHWIFSQMDEPPQKNQTGARQGTSPFWDEHFLFDLSNASSEILFEIYDRPANANEYPKFLGLGLVGIDELAVGPSSCQTIALQPRPYETDPVSGAISVEFVFIEGAQVPVGRRPYKLKEALKLDPNQMDQLMAYEAPAHNINQQVRHSPMLQRQQQQQHQPYMNGNDPNRHLVSFTSFDVLWRCCGENRLSMVFFLRPPECVWRPFDC